MKTIIIALLIAFACSTELNTVEEEQQLMWNPQGLVQCLNEAAPYSKDVIEIIKLVKAKDFETAIAKAIELISDGSQLVKKCIEYIVSSPVSLSVNWPAFGRCLMTLAELYGLGKRLAKALADNNLAEIIAVVTELLRLIEYKIPSQCKKFW